MSLHEAAYSRRDPRRPQVDWRRYAGERWRGKVPCPEKAHPLVRRLIAECNAQKTTLSELAERAGVSRQTICAWRYTGNPALENLIACFNVLGLDLVVASLDDAGRAA